MGDTDLCDPAARIAEIAPALEVGSTSTMYWMRFGVSIVYSRMKVELLDWVWEMSQNVFCNSVTMSYEGGGATDRTYLAFELRS